MTDLSRRTAPEPAQPASTDPTPTLPSGASDATLWIFLGGVILLLMICVVFILIAS